MTHREYTLTVEKTIYESLAGIKAVHKNIGQTVTLNQQDFDRIKEGHDIVRHDIGAGHGEFASITFGKENFANEVTYTEDTVSTGVAKLGKRKSK